MSEITVGDFVTFTIEHVWCWKGGSSEFLHGELLQDNVERSSVAIVLSLHSEPGAYVDGNEYFVWSEDCRRVNDV